MLSFISEILLLKKEQKLINPPIIIQGINMINNNIVIFKPKTFNWYHSLYISITC